MKLTAEQTESARAILRSNDESFLYLLRVAGLDPAKVLPGADLREVVFTRDDNLNGMDFSYCDLRGADLTQAVGVEQAVFTGAISDARTRGLPPAQPAVIFDAHKVREMILNGGAPPEAWVPFITHLNFMGEKHFSDLTPLVGLSALQSLYLHGTHVTELMSLAGLSALQRLDLTSTPVTDLTPLAGLCALQWLDLTNTSVTDLVPLAGLSALQSLDATNTRVTDLVPLAGLPALQWLDLTNTPVTDLNPLACLSALQRLDLTNTPVTDLTPLAGLPALQRLDLTNTPVTDLTPLAGVTRLGRLTVARMQGTDVRYLRHLKSLNIVGDHST